MNIPIKIFSLKQTLSKIIRFKTKIAKENETSKLTPYILLKATHNDHAEIMDLMKKSYYRHEPVSFALKITPNPLLDELTKKILCEGLTIVAKCRHDGKLVGACINGTVNKWDADLQERIACSVSSENVKQMLLFFAHVTRKAQLFEKYNVRKVYEMCYLFVRPDHRYKGLGLKLLEKSRCLGLDCGYSVIRCDATSLFTAKLCEQMGMLKEIQIPYCTYLKEDLQPLIRPPIPHENVSVYVDVKPNISSP